LQGSVTLKSAVDAKVSVLYSQSLIQMSEASKKKMDVRHSNMLNSPKASLLSEREGVGGQKQIERKAYAQGLIG